MARDNPRILLLTGDLGFGVFDSFRQNQPEQFLNAGVAEQNMTLLATGLALEGFVPFTYSIGNFPTLRCLEMIRNDAAYHGANVKVVAIGGGFSYGALGISHHATEDLAILRALPDVTVLAPCGLWEAMEATEAIVQIPGTCYLRLDKDRGDDGARLGEVFRVGQARVLREGADCAILVSGGILREVQSAAAILQTAGVSARIVSVHSLKPFDEETVLRAARETGIVVTVEEHTVTGGLGGAVAEVLLSRGVFPQRFLRIGLEGCFSSTVGSQEYLRRAYRMDSASIASRVMALVRGA